MPDAGYNNNKNKFFSHYAPRLHRFNVMLDPTQASMDLSLEGGFTLVDNHRRILTGSHPERGASGHGAATGRLLPTKQYNSGNSLPGHKPINLVSIDPEGLAVLDDGSFYVSDETGPNIYYFSPNGKLLDVLSTPNAFKPKYKGGGNINGVSYAPTDEEVVTGRRGNQGFEGISVTPDQKYLAAILQSALLQDSRDLNGKDKNKETRNNTRLLIYDITAKPAKLSAHYVLAPPTLQSVSAQGNEISSDTTVASELVALNQRQFLILCRDNYGRNVESAPAPRGFATNTRVSIFSYIQEYTSY